MVPVPEQKWLSDFGDYFKPSSASFGVYIIRSSYGTGNRT
ncbi:protein of unknown function [Shewanella benthica]|uniref:Uncharacterized protein n=1 Tax=Shewanella benthica TaxID=43661 RepID=A0A330MDK6_9GAMM|nr:protein of unknown function [Shewanella benthica]